MFGPHLVLEAYNCKNKNKLADKDTIRQLLAEFPSQLNMTTIMEPQVMYYDGGEIPDDKGVSGFVIIAESHIAIHTFAEKGFLTLDIFSCKEFNIEAAIDYVLRFFEPTHYEHKVFDRGREFPRSLGRAAQIVGNERCRVQHNRELVGVK